MAETNDLVLGERKRLHLNDDGETPVYVIWPNYTGTSSDPAIAITGDGGDFRLAVLSVGVGECDITVTRASDGGIATVHVTVTAPEPPPEDPFTVHLGETF